MKTKLKLLLGILWLLNFRSSTAKSADAIAPFIDERTIFVARLDLDRVDMGATQQWLQDAARVAQLPAITDGRLGDREARSIAQREGLKIFGWVEEFRAAGGKSLYLVVNFVDKGSNSYYMAPLEYRADEKALTAALMHLPGNQNKSVINGKALFVGDDAALAFLMGFKPVNRPELAQAFAAAGDAPIRAALIPSADVRRVLDALLPTEVGGVRIEGLARSLQWVTLAIKSPPAPFLHIQFEASSADAAKSVADVWRQVVAIARQNHVQDQVVLPDLLAAISAPRIEGSKVMLGLEADELKKTADQLAAPFVAAREQAAIVGSMNNVRQMLLGSAMYANAHKNGPFPDSFEELVIDQDMSKEILNNPREPGRHPGYVYIKPPSQSETKGVGDNHRLVIYEAHDAGAQKIVVGFADGHAEVVNEAAFKKLLEEAATRPSK